MSQIYSNLYDIVNQRMSESGGTLLCSKEAFMVMTQSEPGIMDGKQLISLENDVFIEAVYLTYLKRLPDPQSRQMWQYYAHHKERKQFQRMLIDSVLDSDEAITKGSSFIHNCVTELTMRDWKALEVGNVQKEINPTLKDKLYKVYEKMPIRLQIVIRKILRRG